ncbi:hypothetical protein K437DRAFT_268929 [Tilletiaria anomala UBC 951]|uniref:Plastocyanin-like domain-containing protein n=1 Tax=Tilletiaria anomala (strain ATCC 24038 / CBS 436.72 / UBC 951) TaxID=1037660 RepID=A0A066VRI1_TILAU|nr:uncharacterized protein K437DRAFT_268929 [Tilletiaria anomala UBC 951]KDN44101.1 hypothetical protein K437DRAFT_268929 [Tilletiaria anomala UBC 951]
MHDPPMRDGWNLPRDDSVEQRHRVDWPSATLMQCHISHLAAGMALVFDEDAEPWVQVAV